MPYPIALCVVFDGGEWQFENVQNLERVLQEFAVGRDLCKINV